MQYTEHASCIVRHVMDSLRTTKEKNEFLCGAYVVGPRSWYEQWCAWFGFVPAFVACSHHSDKPVYRITTNRIPEILFGIREGRTWIQLEKHDPTKYPLAHLWDFLVYCVTHKNQGPLGESEHTESDPIFANEPAATSPAARNKTALLTASQGVPPAALAVRKAET